MNDEVIVSILEQEWDFDSGFFGNLRRGTFDAQMLKRLISILEDISLQKDSHLSRRTVSLLWYMPLFMGWQRESIKESGGSLEDFDKATNLVQSFIERILGVP